LLAVTPPHTAAVAGRGGSEVPFRRHACRQQVAKCSLIPIYGANRRTGVFVAYCSLRLKRPPSDMRPGRPREGRRGAGEGQAGRRSASPVSRAHFVLGFFFFSTRSSRTPDRKTSEKQYKNRPSQQTRFKTANRGPVRRFRVPCLQEERWRLCSQRDAPRTTALLAARALAVGVLGDGR
jgi:hypothetical protein